MTEVEAAVRQLGKAIQADPRYQAYWKAKTDNDADTELQENIQAFNLKKMSYQHETEKRRHSSGVRRDLYAVPQPAGNLVLGQGKMLCFRKMAGSAGALYPVCVWRLGDVRCAVCTDLFPVSGESQGKMADVQRHYTGVLCQHAGK